MGRKKIRDAKPLAATRGASFRSCRADGKIGNLPHETSNPRALALHVLLEDSKHKQFVQDILDRQLARSALSAADRRLATQLTYGVMRRRGTLDSLLRASANRRRDQVEPWLWEALRIGVFQLALMSHIPPHAAIYETVELAEVFGKPRGKKFLNGILRKVASLLTDEPISAPAMDSLPVGQGGGEVTCVYRKLTQPVFPDPQTKPIDYLASACSLPRWLAERWLDRYGWVESLRLACWFNEPAPVWLRCNRLKVTRDDLMHAFAKASVEAQEGSHAQGIRLVSHAPIATLPGYLDGWFAVQDESAMWVGDALYPEPGTRVLDMCAAPGGKTTHLAELMKNEGSIIACDIDRQRLGILAEQCRRLGVTIVEPKLLDRTNNEKPPPGPYDCILVDAPCSNTGVLGRRPDLRWRLKPGDFPRLVQLQTKLLLQAAERIRSGGTIVYSTCSIEPQENRQIVQAVMQAMPDLKLEEESARIPGQPADGGYWVRLRK